jgi:dienelactone hydrolase
MKTMETQHLIKGINKCVRIRVGDLYLLGDLQIPEEAVALVIFAYGSGRSRNNPRNRHTAQIFRMHGIGTLICELLSEDEEIEDEATEKFRHDAGLLAKRLVEVTRWAASQSEIKQLPVGYFGVCAGGAAAVIAAGRASSKVGAVVSRGGRMDLAVKSLSHVKCPILLIVGEKDTVGMELNREARARLGCPKQLVEVAGASHLFGEPGKLEEMAELSAEWFRKHLGELKRQG